MNRVRVKSLIESLRRRPALLALLGGMLLTTPLYAQNTVALRGQVADETGAVIPGAQITLVSATGKRRAASSNAAGEFTLNNVMQGDYQLTVTSIGMGTGLDQSPPFPLCWRQRDLAAWLPAESVSDGFIRYAH